MKISKIIQNINKNIHLTGEVTDRVTKCTYLCTLVTSTNDYVKEIKIQIGMARFIFVNMKFV